MNVKALVDSLQGCSCGKLHQVNIKAVEIGPGLLAKTAEILMENDFPREILVVADQNTLKAADGILKILEEGGFRLTTKFYDDLRVADMIYVKELVPLCAKTKGILAVGSGSLGDICRLAALMANQEFAIFATAPSMDGFASGTSPITENGFKTTRQARQPSIIIGDTGILAASPAELKAAGFGDIVAKYTALADWRVSHLVTGEHYCEAIAEITRSALRKVTALADNVTDEDEETAGAIMEALVLTGLAMKLGDSVRPASGTEHIISHFWEIKKLEKGILSDYHGKKCCVATLYAARIYHAMIACESISIHDDRTEWADVYRAYGPLFEDEVRKLNCPTVTDETAPEIVRANWQAICQAVREEIPTPDRLLDLIRRAGAASSIEDIAVEHDMGVAGLRYHPYMRHRMTLMRLIPMTDFVVDYEKVLED